MTRRQRILSVIERDRKLLAMAQRSLPETWTRKNLAMAIDLSYSKASLRLTEWRYIGIVRPCQSRTGGLERFRFTIRDLHNLDLKPLPDIWTLGA